jgi:hypothetical protein
VLIDTDRGDAAAQRRPAGPPDDQGGLADHDQVTDRQFPGRFSRVAYDGVS